MSLFFPEYIFRSYIPVAIATAVISKIFNSFLKEKIMDKKVEKEKKNAQQPNPSRKKKDWDNAEHGDLIKRDDRFKDLFPPQDEAVRAILEEQLIRDGLKDPLTLWRNNLVDGYLRFELCNAHGIPIHTRDLEVPTENDAISWKIEYELGRRHLNSFQRAEVALRQKAYFVQKAAENRGKRTDIEPLTQKGQRFTPIDTARKIGELAQLGKNTINSVEYVLENYAKVKGGDLILAKARRKELSPSAAKNEIKKQIKKLERNDFQHKHFDYKNPEAGKWVNQVICGDAIATLKEFNKTMAGTAAAVITSIPYNCGVEYGNAKDGTPIDDNKPYPEYVRFLLDFILEAEKAIRDQGRIIINCDNILNADRDESDCYRFPIDVDLIHGIQKLNSTGESKLKLYHRIIWYKGETTLRTQFGSFSECSNPCQNVVHENIISWCKGDIKLENVTGNKSDMDAKDFKLFNQSVWAINPNTKKTIFPCKMSDELARRLVKYFTYPGDLIIDCFCGSGSTLTASLALKRDFLGVDIGPHWCHLSSEEIQRVRDNMNKDDDPSDDDKYHFAA